ncbi:MAG: hypothetical protein RLZZ338_669 [Cyanobacteriota bacterium]|jgi:CheY-like chemotaxis protein
MQPTTTLSASQTKPTILIVDDLIDNIQVLALFLECHGYSITYALNAQEALERLNVIHPDLILLDLFMPNVNGLQLCEKIKENADYQDIPILFLTASHEHQHIISAFEKGAEDYVMKPFNTKEVLARIATHIKLKRQTIELKNVKNKFETIVTHVLDGLLVINKDGIILFANPSVCQMFDKTINSLLGHSLGIPIIEKKVTQIEILRLNGKPGIAEITAAQAQWDNQPVSIVCLRDISDRADIKVE